MHRYKSILAVAAATAALLFGSCSHKSSDTTRMPVRVNVMAVGQGSPTGTGAGSYSGTIEAATGSELSFADAGTVRKVYVSVGDKVKRGQLLAELDNAQLSGAYDIAKAELAEARDAYRRLAMLHDAKALPEIRWVEMQSKLRQAESAAEIARKALDNARLYSPVTGVVAARNVDAGMNVAPAVPVLKVVTVDDLRATITVPENIVDRFATGSECTFTVKGVDSTQYSGKLVEKGVEADPLTREYTLKYKVENPDRRLLPGMICSLTPALKSPAPETVAQGRVTVPERCVLLDFDNRTFVWLVSEGKALKRYVTVAGITPAGLQISDGLADGDSIIVDGQQKVSSGMAVEAVVGNS